MSYAMPHWIKFLKNSDKENIFKAAREKKTQCNLEGSGAHLKVLKERKYQPRILNLAKL